VTLEPAVQVDVVHAHHRPSPYESSAMGRAAYRALSSLNTRRRLFGELFELRCGGFRLLPALGGGRFGLASGDSRAVRLALGGLRSRLELAEALHERAPPALELAFPPPAPGQGVAVLRGLPPPGRPHVHPGER